MDAIATNPRAVVGNNNPPADMPPAAEQAAPIVGELNTFLSNHPVIANDGESRVAKEILDRIANAFKSIETERDGKVRPLNTQVTKINADYHKWHNTNDKKPGVWNTLVREAWIRLDAYAKAEEKRRLAVLEAARAVKEEAERKAREAEAAEKQIIQDAADGVWGADLAGATEAADAEFRRFEQASRFVARAEKDTKVRIVGGSGNAVSIRERETLTVTDWRKAIEAIGINDDPDEPFRLPKELADCICKVARDFRKAFGELPPGITATFDRRL
jgi:hypothetical protein